MAGVFDNKYFNAEVFQQYMSRVPNTRLNMLVQSRAIVARPELASAMSDQVGGNYLSTPLRGLIDGAPLNYDGNTNITASSTKTYMHSRESLGGVGLLLRHHGWRGLHGECGPAVEPVLADC